MVSLNAGAIVGAFKLPGNSKLSVLIIESESN